MTAKNNIKPRLKEIPEDIPLHKLVEMPSDASKFKCFLYLKKAPLASDVFDFKEIESFNSLCSNYLVMSLNEVVGAYVRSYVLKTRLKNFYMYLGDDNSDKESFDVLHTDFGGLIVYKGNMSSLLFVPSEVDAPMLVRDFG